jgi:hypothetical protein
VERVLDASHALMSHGVHRYPRRRTPDLRTEQKREQERHEHHQRMFNDLWRTVPAKPGAKNPLSDRDRRRAAMVADPAWAEFAKATGGLGALKAQNTMILKPVPWSPIR